MSALQPPQEVEEKRNLNHYQTKHHQTIPPYLNQSIPHPLSNGGITSPQLTYAAILKGNTPSVSSQASSSTKAQTFKPFSVDCATPLNGNISTHSNLVFGDFDPKINFLLKPTMDYCGKKAILFQKSDKLRLLKRVPHVLIGKFSHGRPPMSVIKNFFCSLKLKGSYNISLFDSKHMYIECVMFEDFIRIWLEKLWLVRGFQMRVFKWSADFHPIFESPVAPVWVHLYGLPLYLFDKEALMSIANAIGSPRGISSNTLNRSNLSYASLCVELDLTRPLLDEVWIDFGKEKRGPEESFEQRVGFWQSLSYGTIPSYCSCCAHIGHSLESCKRKTANSSAAFLVNCPVVTVEKDSSPDQLATRNVFSGMQSSQEGQDITVLLDCAGAVVAADNAGAVGESIAEIAGAEMSVGVGVAVMEDRMQGLSEIVARQIACGGQDPLTASVDKEIKAMEPAAESVLEYAVSVSAAADGRGLEIKGFAAELDTGRLLDAVAAKSVHEEVLVEDITLEDGEIDESYEHSIDRVWSLSQDPNKLAEMAVKTALEKAQTGRTVEQEHSIVENSCINNDIAGLLQDRQDKMGSNCNHDDNSGQLAILEEVQLASGISPDNTSPQKLGPAAPAGCGQDIAVAPGSSLSVQVQGHPGWKQVYGMLVRPFTVGAVAGAAGPAALRAAGMDGGSTGQVMHAGKELSSAQESQGVPTSWKNAGNQEAEAEENASHVVLHPGADFTSLTESAELEVDSCTHSRRKQNESRADLVEKEHEQQFAREQKSILEWDVTQVKAYVHKQIEEIKQETGQTKPKIRDADKEEKKEQRSMWNHVELGTQGLTTEAETPLNTKCRNSHTASTPRKLSSVAAEFTPKWAVSVEELVAEEKESDPVLVEEEKTSTSKVFISDFQNIPGRIDFEMIQSILKRPSKKDMNNPLLKQTRTSETTDLGDFCLPLKADSEPSSPASEVEEQDWSTYKRGGRHGKKKGRSAKKKH